MEKQLMSMIVFNNLLLKSILICLVGEKNAKNVIKVCLKDAEKVMESEEVTYDEDSRN